MPEAGEKGRISVSLVGGPPWGFRIGNRAEPKDPVIVSQVIAGSRAANEGVLSGDRVLSINGKALDEGQQNGEIQRYLKRASGVLRLNIQRPIPGQVPVNQGEEKKEIVSTDPTKKSLLSHAKELSPRFGRKLIPSAPFAPLNQAIMRASHENISLRGASPVQTLTTARLPVGGTIPKTRRWAPVNFSPGSAQHFQAAYDPHYPQLGGPTNQTSSISFHSAPVTPLGPLSPTPSDSSIPGRVGQGRPGLEGEEGEKRVSRESIISIKDEEKTRRRVGKAESTDGIYSQGHPMAITISSIKRASYRSVRGSNRFQSLEALREGLQVPKEDSSSVTPTPNTVEQNLGPQPRKIPPPPVPPKPRGAKRPQNMSASSIPNMLGGYQNPNVPHQNPDSGLPAESRPSVGAENVVTTQPTSFNSSSAFLASLDKDPEALLTYPPSIRNVLSPLQQRPYSALDDLRPRSDSIISDHPSLATASLDMDVSDTQSRAADLDGIFEYGMEASGGPTGASISTSFSGEGLSSDLLGPFYPESKSFRKGGTTMISSTHMNITKDSTDSKSSQPNSAPDWSTSEEAPRTSLNASRHLSTIPSQSEGESSYSGIVTEDLVHEKEPYYPRAFEDSQDYNKDTPKPFSASSSRPQPNSKASNELATPAMKPPPSPSSGGFTHSPTGGFHSPALQQKMIPGYSPVRFVPPPSSNPPPVSAPTTPADPPPIFPKPPGPPPAAAGVPPPPPPPPSGQPSNLIWSSSATYQQTQESVGQGDSSIEIPEKKSVASLRSALESKLNGATPGHKEPPPQIPLSQLTETSHQLEAAAQAIQSTARPLLEKSPASTPLSSAAPPLFSSSSGSAAFSSSTLPPAFSSATSTRNEMYVSTGDYGRNLGSSFSTMPPPPPPAPAGVQMAAPFTNPRTEASTTSFTSLRTESTANVAPPPLSVNRTMSYPGEASYHQPLPSPGATLYSGTGTGVLTPTGQGRASQPPRGMSPSRPISQSSYHQYGYSMGADSPAPPRPPLPPAADLSPMPPWSRQYDEASLRAGSVPASAIRRGASPPRDAVLVERKSSIEGNQVRTDSYYALPYRETTTNVRHVPGRGDMKYAPGPAPDGALREHVPEGYGHHWYKMMYRKLHQIDKDEEIRDRDPYLVSYRMSDRSDRVSEPDLDFEPGYIPRPYMADRHRGGGSSRYREENQRRARSVGRYEAVSSPTSFLGGVVKSTPAGERPYKVQPKRIEDYIPGDSSIARFEEDVTEGNRSWDAHSDIVSNWRRERRGLRGSDSRQRSNSAAGHRPSGLGGSSYNQRYFYTMDSRHGRGRELSPMSNEEARRWYRSIQAGGDVPFGGLRQPAPERRDSLLRTALHILVQQIESPEGSEAGASPRRRQISTQTSISLDKGQEIPAHPPPVKTYSLLEKYEQSPCSSAQSSSSSRNYLAYQDNFPDHRSASPGKPSRPPSAANKTDHQHRNYGNYWKLSFQPCHQPFRYFAPTEEDYFCGITKPRSTAKPHMGSPNRTSNLPVASQQRSSGRYASERSKVVDFHLPPHRTSPERRRDMSPSREQSLYSKRVGGHPLSPLAPPPLTAQQRRIMANREIAWAEIEAYYAFLKQNDKETCTSSNGRHRGGEFDQETDRKEVLWKQRILAPHKARLYEKEKSYVEMCEELKAAIRDIDSMTIDSARSLKILPTSSNRPFYASDNQVLLPGVMQRSSSFPDGFVGNGFSSNYFHSSGPTRENEKLSRYEERIKLNSGKHQLLEGSSMGMLRQLYPSPSKATQSFTNETVRGSRHDRISRATSLPHISEKSNEDSSSSCPGTHRNVEDSMIRSQSASCLSLLQDQSKNTDPDSMNGNSNGDWTDKAVEYSASSHVSHLSIPSGLRNGKNDRDNPQFFYRRLRNREGADPQSGHPTTPSTEVTSGSCVTTPGYTARPNLGDPDTQLMSRSFSEPSIPDIKTQNGDGEPMSGRSTSRSSKSSSSPRKRPSQPRSRSAHNARTENQKRQQILLTQQVHGYHHYLYRNGYDSSRSASYNNPSYCLATNPPHEKTNVPQSPYLVYSNYHETTTPILTAPSVWDILLTDDNYGPSGTQRNLSAAESLRRDLYREESPYGGQRSPSRNQTPLGDMGSEGIDPRRREAIFEEERRKRAERELEDLRSRRHGYIPQKSPGLPLASETSLINLKSDYGTPARGKSPRMRSKSPGIEMRGVAKALYTFNATNAKELPFQKGDLIRIRKMLDQNWYEGELRGRVGLLPVNYVEMTEVGEVSSGVVRTEVKEMKEGQAKATYNFEARNTNEISLTKGEILALTKRVDTNWYEGRTGNGRVGIFPSNYVEVIREPSSKETSYSTALPSSASRKTPKRDDPGESRVQVNGVPYGKSGVSSIMKTSSSTSTRSIGGPYTNPPSTKPAPNRTADHGLDVKAWELRHTAQQLSGTSGRAPQNSDTYQAVYSYRPMNPDELELKEGDIVYVVEKCDDGWFIGTSLRTGSFGTFPGNYVQLM